ncbi:MAG: hypothetical protein JWO82_4348 [Akkermansiaceae bacterium]|nr:hypothetical protein [Akkermansiaceae bacterium]
MSAFTLRLSRAATLIGLALVAPLSGASFVNTTITFNEPAFPTSNTPVSGNQSYNVLNDSTGAIISTAGELAGLTGDSADLFMNFQSTAGPLGSASWQWQPTSTGRFTASHSYAGAVGVNNPGSLTSNSVTLTFGSHVSVIDLSLHGLSFNTAGIAWEYSVIEFLRPDGSSFSAAPTIGSYLSQASINGSPSTGWYVIDSRGTVAGVGGSSTTAGTSGSNDNLAGAGLGYANVGLAPGTAIGGVRITTFLEDVRGTANGATNFTSSFTDFTFSGAVVPEPAPALICAVAGGLFLLGRSRRP